MYDYGHQDRRVTIRLTFKEYERYMELPGTFGSWHRTISDIIRQALKRAVEAQDADRKRAAELTVKRPAQDDLEVASDADRRQTKSTRPRKTTAASDKARAIPQAVARGKAMKKGA